MSSKSSRFISAEGNEMRWVKKDHYTKRKKKRKEDKLARRRNRGLK